MSKGLIGEYGVAGVNSTGQPRKNNLVYNGDPDTYELWKIKFVSYLKLRDLDGKSDGNGTVSVDKNALVFAELVQLMDDSSLSLIIKRCER